MLRVARRDARMVGKVVVVKELLAFDGVSGKLKGNFCEVSH